MVILGLWSFRYLENTADNQHELEDIPFPRFYDTWIFTPLRRNDEATYIRLMTECYEAVKRKENKFREYERSILAPLTGMIFPVYNRVYESTDETDVLLQAGLAAVHLLQGKKAEVTSPLKIEERDEWSWIIRFPSEGENPTSNKSDQKKWEDWIVPK